jgi:tRNA 2-thiouridine synthesizing protein B
MLHIVNKSPYERPALDTCLRTAQRGETVLLIEDGVFAATSGSVWLAQMQSSGLRCCALQADLEARGLKDRLGAGVEVVDAGGFVDLVAGHSTNQSWL